MAALMYGALLKKREKGRKGKKEIGAEIRKVKKKEKRGQCELMGIQ